MSIYASAKKVPKSKANLLKLPHKPVKYVYVTVDGYINFIEVLLGQSWRWYGRMCVGTAIGPTIRIAYIYIQIIAEVLHFFD